MSDQDFFFEDEEADAAEKTEAKKPAAKAGTKPTSKPGVKPAPKPAQAAQAGPASSGSFFDQQVSMAVASLIAVIALLVGVIGGFMLGGSGTPVEVPASNTQTAPGAQTAPQLTPEQLNSGQVPEGHPPLGGAATGTAGSNAATPAK